MRPMRTTETGYTRRTGSGPTRRGSVALVALLAAVVFLMAFTPSAMAQLIADVPETVEDTTIPATDDTATTPAAEDAATAAATDAAAATPAAGDTATASATDDTTTATTPAP